MSYLFVFFEGKQIDIVALELLIAQAGKLEVESDVGGLHGEAITCSIWCMMRSFSSPKLAMVTSISC